MNLKATFVSGVYPHPNRFCWPGIERLVEGLSEALVRKGVEVSVVTSYRLGGERDFEVLPSGVKLFRVRSLLDFRPFGVLGLNQANFSLFTFGKYLKLLKESDVVHVFAVSLVPVGPLKNSLPPVLSYFPHFDLPKSLLDLFYVPYINFLFYLLCKASDIITVGVPPNSSQLSEFLEFFDVPVEKIRFLYQGVNPRKFNLNIETSEIKNRFNGRIVLYAGPLIPRKGLVHLVNAIPKVAKEVTDVKFVFLGKGEQRGSLEKLARQLGIDEHVFFEGFVSEADLPKYYAAADVFAFPSLRDGYALVCLEAMACGTPIVATNLGTIAEIVGDTGILVDEGDSASLAEGIITLLTDSNLRKKLGGKAGMRVKEHFTWDRVTDRLVEIYKEVIEHQKHDR